MSVPLSPARAALAVMTVLGGICGLLLGWASPSGAVQTTTFSLTATGERTSIIVFSGTGTRTDHFALHNLRSRPITVGLQVLSLAKSGSGFKVGPPGAGFSADVRLASSAVRLGSRATKVLPVRVDTDYDGHSEHFAVIDAHLLTRPTPGANAPHLQLAIELKPSPPRGNAGASSSSTGTDVVLGVAAALIAIALIALAVVARRRRGRAPGER